MYIKILILLSFFCISGSAEILENNEKKTTIDRNLVEFCLTCNGWDCDARDCSGSNYRIFDHIPQEIREDKVFSIKMLQEAPHYLKHISPIFQDDKEIVSLAVQVSGRDLMYASTRLQKDRELVHLALKSDGFYLCHLQKKFHNDKELILQGLSTTGRAFSCVPKDLKKDLELIQTALVSDGLALEYVPSSFKEDEEILLLALKSNVKAFKYVNQAFSENRQFIKKALKVNPLFFKYISSTLQKDKSLQRLRREYAAQNSEEIKRKVKSSAWNQYSVKDTLIELYGEQTKFIETDEINIGLPEIASNISRIPILINSTIKAKSAAVVKDEEDQKSLVGFFQLNNLPLDNYRFLFALNKHGVESNLWVIIEGMDGKFYISKPSLVKTYNCTGGYNPPTIKEKKAKLHKAIKDKNYIRQVRYKQNGNKVRMKISLEYPKVTYPMAKLWNERVDFISHIVVKMDNEIVYDFYPSEALSTVSSLKLRAYPRSLSVKNIEVILTNIHGEVATYNTRYEKRDFISYLIIQG